MSNVGDAAAALERKQKIRRKADEKLDKLLDSDPPAPEEMVTKATLDLTQAEWAEAKAKLWLAEAQGATPGEIAELKEEVVLAELKKDAAQAKVDKNEERLKSLCAFIDAKRTASSKLSGQLSSTGCFLCCWCFMKHAVVDFKCLGFAVA